MDRQGKKILVVEDSHLVRLKVRNALARRGYEVVELARAEDMFLSRSLFNELALIILDINLPGLDGLAALEKIRADASLPYVPVMMLTGSADRKTVQRAINLGAVEYLIKPFTDEALLRRVEKILGPPVEPPDLRALMEQEVRLEVKRAKRGGHVFSLLLVQPPVAPAGEALETLREKLQAAMRETDTCLVTPERQFLLILPFTSREGAKVVEKKAAETLAPELEGTLSFATVAFPEDGEDERELLAALEKPARAQEDPAQDSGLEGDESKTVPSGEPPHDT